MTPSSESERRQNQTDCLACQWLTAFASFYNVSLRERGERFVEMWIAALSDLRPEELQAACEMATRTCRFFPLPAEIRSQVDPHEARRIASERWLSNQPSDEELRRRGLEYCESVKAWSLEIAKLQRESALKVKPEPIVIATKERIEKLERQKRELLARSTPEQIRQAGRLRAS
jgi:hypothetical protein